MNKLLLSAVSFNLVTGIMATCGIERTEAAEIKTSSNSVNSVYCEMRAKKDGTTDVSLVVLNKISPVIVRSTVTKNHKGYNGKYEGLIQCRSVAHKIASSKDKDEIRLNNDPRLAWSQVLNSTPESIRKDRLNVESLRPKKSVAGASYSEVKTTAEAISSVFCELKARNDGTTDVRMIITSSSAPTQFVHALVKNYRGFNAKYEGLVLCNQQAHNIAGLKGDVRINTAKTLGWTRVLADNSEPVKTASRNSVK
jgi:hypothetical protein